MAMNNWELSVLWNQLGDGIAFNAASATATFRSRASAETFRAHAPSFWTVRYIRQE